jgi:hypothetical protein
MTTPKLSQIRQLNGDFARNYKYEFELIVPTTSTSLSGIVNSTAVVAQGGVTPTATISTLLTHSCLNCVVPSVGVQEISVEVGMHTMRLNGRHETSGTISPEFILSGDYRLYKFFRAWAGLAAYHNDDVQVIQSLIFGTLNITSKDVTNVTQLSTELQNVWCRNCPEMSYSDDSNDIIRFAPELVYEFAKQS